jgi:hypothetical protein
MLPLKIALYVLTLGTAILLEFWERKLKHQLTDDILEKQRENVSDIDSFYGFRRNLRRERILKGLPREALLKLRIIVGLKFLLLAVLAIEVFVLQS